ncbi:MAG TPA: RelA/SpoT domain-containing protein [Methylocella sp.]
MGDAEFLRGYFERLLCRCGYSSLIVEARPKPLASAIDKIRRKCADENSPYCSRILNGEPPERILTDLVGVRITCKFSDQIDEVEALLAKNFSLRDIERIDHRKPKHYGNFGYAALHLVADPIQTSVTQIYFSDCAFEIQIRSALMDVWSVVNWDIAYTEERKAPYELLRRMSTLSALFYLVDQEFIRIRDEMSEESNALRSVTGDQAFEFSTEIAGALAKRGITFDLRDRAKLVDFAEKARTYIAKDGDLGRIVTVDALALYLFDRDRFAWIVNERTAKAVDDIDRAAGHR